MRGVFDVKAYNADKAHRSAMVVAEKEKSDACKETLPADPAHREPALKEPPAEPNMMEADDVDPASAS